jgi:hypothetical protein
LARYHVACLFLHKAKNRLMRGKALYIAMLVLIGMSLINTACKKNQTLTTGGTLTFSVDTLKFDTVFTAAGSFTLNFKIYNPQNEAINISSVYLQNGTASYFHLNVDGFPGNNATNIHIAAHDSVYVFATVDIDPTNANSPFVITDSLVATLNGNNYYVPFTAYGQNAHYIVDSVLPTGTTTWLTDLPYVILQSAEVPANAKLVIPGGCRIYMNADASLIVYGTLLANGSPQDTIVFQGDRLDRSYFGYEGYPGEWGGIYFGLPSSGNVLNYVRLENCGNGAEGMQQSGIEIYDYDSADNGVNPIPQVDVMLNHVQIANSIGFGVLNWGGYLVATNSLIDICGSQALANIQGGYDSITNCTLTGYSTDGVSHVNSTLALLNFYQVDQVTFLTGNLNAVMQNCIVWGSLDSEVFCDSLSSAAANVRFNNCLMSVGTLPGFVSTSNCIFNQDPLFKSTTSTGGTNGLDFHLTAASPAIHQGLYIPAADTDFDGYVRTPPFDIGCYQYH